MRGKASSVFYFKHHTSFLRLNKNECKHVCCYFQEVVKVENVNCIAVEWKKGVKTQYAIAANNVRVVAAQVASMITFLMVNIALF